MKVRIVLFCIVGVAHAETAVDGLVAPRCTDPAYADCAGKVEGTDCVQCIGGGTCTCAPSVCNDDAGTATSAMHCSRILLCKDEPTCVGKKEGARCGSDGFTCTLSGGCWKHVDDGYVESGDLHCTQTGAPPDAGTMPPTSSSGCSCTSGGERPRTWLSAFVTIGRARAQFGRERSQPA